MEKETTATSASRTAREKSAVHPHIWHIHLSLYVPPG